MSNVLASLVECLCNVIKTSIKAIIVSTDDIDNMFENRMKMFYSRMVETVHAADCTSSSETNANGRVRMKVQLIASVFTLSIHFASFQLRNSMLCLDNYRL